MEKINVVYFRAKRAEIGGEERGWNKDQDSHDGEQQCRLVHWGGREGGIVIEEKAR